MTKLRTIPAEAVYPVMDSYCNFTDHWEPWVDTFSLIVSQGILVLRVNALCAYHKDLVSAAWKTDSSNLIC